MFFSTIDSSMEVDTSLSLIMIILVATMIMKSLVVMIIAVLIVVVRTVIVMIIVIHQGVIEKEFQMKISLMNLKTIRKGLLSSICLTLQMKSVMKLPFQPQINQALVPGH
jgi:hypothetical protein